MIINPVIRPVIINPVFINPVLRPVIRPVIINPVIINPVIINPVLRPVIINPVCVWNAPAVQFEIRFNNWLLKNLLWSTSSVVQNQTVQVQYEKAVLKYLSWISPHVPVLPIMHNVPSYTTLL